MKSRAEVARPLSAPGALVMLMWGGCGPQRPSPTPLQSVICQGRGVYAARPALMYTFSAGPLSLLGPGKRVVTFAVNNEF